MPDPSTMPDTKRMEAAVHEYVAAFDAGDAGRIANLFAQDATVEDPIGTPRHVGKAAIEGFYRESMKTGAKLSLEGPVRLAQDYAVFAFSVRLSMYGADARIDVIDTFQFNEDSKVVEMRAYWGPANMHGLEQE